MKKSDRTRFIRDVETEQDVIMARRPFKVEQDNKRRFIRLEISSPMAMQRIKDSTGGYWPEGEDRVIEGSILNISAGGVLVELNEIVNHGDVVAMRFTLQGIESLDNVLGLVKRVDEQDGAILVGIQFITRENLDDLFTGAEVDLLPKKYSDFTEGMREILNRHVYKERTPGVV